MSATQNSPDANGKIVNPHFAIVRRIGPDPHANGAQTVALNNCPDLFELESGDFAVIGIVGSLLLAGYAAWKGAQAWRIGNLFAIAESYRDIWKELYERPALFRVLQKDVDLKQQPISDVEWLFVKSLILHFDMVRRAAKFKMFVKLEGQHMDVKEFFMLPIPAAVWERIKRFQDRNFVTLIEVARGGR